MNLIEKYLMRHLVVSTLIVGSVMTGVIWLFIAVRAVEHIVNRGVSVKIFMYLSLLQIPNFIVHIIPFSIFIATLFVYSRLNSDREIIVMRAAGMSPLSLAKPGLLLAFIAMLIGYALTLYVTPKSYQNFRNLQWDVRYSFAHVLLREGVFNLISDKVTVFIRERTGESELRGILYYDIQNKTKPLTIVAERGILTKNSGAVRVTVYDGSRQERDIKNNKLSVLYFDEYTIDLSSFTPKPEERFREGRERMVNELLSLKPQDVGNQRDFGKFKVEGHQRLVTPINTFVFVFVALACLLLGDFSRRGQSKRIMLAALIFVCLWLGNLGIANISSNNLRLVPILYYTTIGPIILLLLLFVLSPYSKKYLKKFRIYNLLRQAVDMRIN
jgi:lipopolysaccharide export system permease protein